MSEDHFTKALRNFTMDAAAGDAIRHLCDKGFTLPQIKDALTFPAPEKYIAEVMWKRLIEKGIVIPSCAECAQGLSARAPVAQTVLDCSAGASRLRNSLCGIPADTRSGSIQY